MNVPNEEYFKHPIINPRFLNKNYPEFYIYLNKNYPYLTSISEKLYWWKYNIKELPRCPVCGKVLKFINFSNGYQHYCSYKCAGASEKRKKQIEETCLKKYGVRNPKQNKQVHDKSKKTNLERYGVENPFASEQIKEKIKEYNKKTYNVEYTGQSEIIKEKIKNTFNKKYNVNSPLELPQTKINREKASKERMRKKYSEYIDTDFDNGLYICKCPHSGCNKCSEKQYSIPMSVFYDRRRERTEPCTKILPFKEGTHTSGPERELHLLLDEKGIIHRDNVWDIIKPKEIDIFLPNYNIGIECNGIYQHCTRKKESNYHILKSKICKERGVKLLHIWEDWIKDKYDITKSIIYSKLNIYDEVIYARKCVVKEINTKISNNFLDNNHIQGRSNSSIKLGLYYRNELVSVMTFGSQSSLSGNKSKDKGIELKRFCSKKFTKVIGGASKLFTYYIKKYKPIKIFSYSSNDISDGNMYMKLGFEKGPVSTSYWWVQKNTYKRYHRSVFSKANIVKLGWKNKVDDSWTEESVMYEKGYVKIIDSGLTKWIWIAP